MRVRCLFYALPVLWGATLSWAAAAGSSNVQPEDVWQSAEDAQARGQNTEAARLYEIAADATDDESLRVLALVSAADAALDGGQRQRAVDLLGRARRSAGAPSVQDLIATLDGQLKALQDASSSSTEISVAPMPGRLGLAEASGVAVLSARASEPRTSHASISNLNGFIFGMVSSGYDSNVSLAAPSAADGDATIAANGGDWFATAFLMANLAHPWNHGATELTYSFFQLAYPQVAHDTYNLQDHLVDVTQRWALWSKLRMSLTGRLGATLSGLRGGLALFQRVTGADAAGVLDESPRARVRVSAGLTARQVQEPTYGYLAGTRYDAAIDQEFRPGAWLLSGGVSYRQEVVGRIFDSLDAAPVGRADVPCGGCALEAVTPYSHRMLGGGLRIRSPSERRLRGGGYVRVEDRLYAAAYLETVPSGGASIPFSYRRRHDRRLLGGVELSVGREPAVAIRYDVTINRSRVDGADGGLCRDAQICHPLDAENHDYSRHMLTLGVDYLLWCL